MAFAKGKPTVTDGPFIETKEVLGGFWIIQVKSKQEALEWAQRCPASDGDVIELREIWEMEDLPEEVQKRAAKREGKEEGLKGGPLIDTNETLME